MAQAQAQIQLMGAQLQQAMAALKERAADRAVEVAQMRVDTRRLEIRAFEAITQRKGVEASGVGKAAPLPVDFTWMIPASLSPSRRIVTDAA